MPDKINGRTPEEIKNALECCNNMADGCSKCPYDTDTEDGWSCVVERNANALAYIQWLEYELSETREYYDCSDAANTELHSALYAMKRERDAAVADMTELMQLAQFCRHCKHITSDGECTFDFAANKGELWCWQWRGVPQEVE